jgi:HD-GYP domain-containing protein (c-di-GMP phosphodiesterase class II)
MAIPDAILSKPGALTESETEIMREHCFRGYQMLKKIPFLSEASEIVYSHQERYDGTGYPRGLSGQNIPLPWKIGEYSDPSRTTCPHCGNEVLLSDERGAP